MRHSTLDDFFFQENSVFGDIVECRVTSAKLVCGFNACPFATSTTCRVSSGRRRIWFARHSTLEINDVCGTYFQIDTKKYADRRVSTIGRRKCSKTAIFVE